MRTRLATLLAALAATLTLAACGGDDGGGGTVDAPRADAPVADAAETDAPSIDATVDATVDAGTDAPTDAIPTSSEYIGFALATADGTGLTLPIVGATITYVKPALGSDLAGFTIQAQQAGPALMVDVNPTTLTPTPTVGDVVDFTITAMGTTGGQRRATAVGAYVRASQGANVGALAQSVSAASDLVTAIASYDSEIIDVTGTIATAFAGGVGAGFEGAQVTTAGMTVAGATFLLRVPATFRDANDMVIGCGFTLDNTPVGRFNAATQLAAFVTADLTLTGCPAPTVVSAAAASATSVQITFSRNVRVSSVMANGSQFTFDNGLTASAATVSGRTVTVTTSAQSGATTYTATVANTVTDLLGTVLGTPNTTTFGGFVTPAVVRINEVNANLGSGCDLIELRVVSGGSMTGFYLRERDAGMLLAFTTFFVATNDVIVVHMSTASATCNPAAATFETTGPAQQPISAHARNYDTAYDWYSTDTGLTATDNVVTLYNNLNAILDVVLIDDDVAPTVATPSNVAAASETQAATAAAANHWQMNGGGIPVAGAGGVPPAGFVDDNFRFHAALDSDAAATSTVTGDSIRRIDNTDENEKADWLQGLNSWGLINAGQTPF